MSLRSKVLAAGAALLLAGGIAALAGTGTATAATPSCGAHCPDVFTKAWGQHDSPANILDVFRQGARVGQPVILFKASASDPAEDWKVTVQASVHDFFLAGMVSSAVNLHYGDDIAVELEYSPYGVESGLCAGTSWIAGNGTRVSLQPCGITSKTVWIIDNAAHNTAEGEGPSGIILAQTDFVTVIAGSDTNFSTPYVLTYPANGNPADRPRPRLMTAPLLHQADGSIPATQMWGYDDGPVK